MKKVGKKKSTPTLVRHFLIDRPIIGTLGNVFIDHGNNITKGISNL